MRTPIRDLRGGLLAFVAGGLMLATGCTKGGKVEDFTPAADNARKSLDTALKHLQDGGAPGTIPGTSPAIELTDTKWKAGQKLASYEILDEEPSTGTSARIFKVRLTPPTGKPIETKYAVLGIDPLLIYRDEDFKKLSGEGK